MKQNTSSTVDAMKNKFPIRSKPIVGEATEYRFIQPDMIVVTVEDQYGEIWTEVYEFKEAHKKIKNNEEN